MPNKTCTECPARVSEWATTCSVRCRARRYRRLMAEDAANAAVEAALEVSADVAAAVRAVEVLDSEDRRAIAAALERMANIYSREYDDAHGKADALTEFSRLCLAIEAEAKRRDRDTARAYRAMRRDHHGVSVEDDRRPGPHPDAITAENAEALVIEAAGAALDEVEDATC